MELTIIEDNLKTILIQLRAQFETLSSDRLIPTLLPSQNSKRDRAKNTIFLS